MIPRSWLGLALAAAAATAWAAPAWAQQAAPARTAEEFAAILAPKPGTRGLKAGALKAGGETEPGVPGSGVVPDLAIRFGFASADLLPDAEAVLDELARTMNRDELRARRFEVGGHTDARGDARYNEGLSRRRAESVVAYLTGRGGVGSKRLAAIGYGEGRLADWDRPEAGVNRRVEVRTVHAD